MSIKINLNASELAVAIGVNPYQNVTDLLIKLWMRHFRDDYNRILKEVKSATNTEIIQETEFQTIQRLTKNNPEIQSKIQDCLRSNSATDLQKQQREIIKDLIKTPSITQEDKRLLEKNLVSVSNKSFGVRKEGDAIAQYEQLTNKTVQRIGKYFRYPIDLSPLETHGLLETEWFLGGKIDGMTTDNELIEVKNRVRRFFNTIRDYEKVQIQTYFKLLDLTDGYLVESLVRKNKSHPTPEINIVKTQFDSHYWDNFLMPRTLRFIDLFHNIILDDYHKMRLLLEDQDDLELEIRSHLTATV